MSAPADWVLRSAGLPGRPGTVDISIRDRRIEAIAGKLDVTGAQELDLQGRLVLPGFVDSHLHMDKAYGLEGSNVPSGDSLDDAIAAFWRWRDEATPQSIYRNARRVAELALTHGTVALRTHVTVDVTAGLTWLEPLVRLREELAHVLTLQIAACPDTADLVSGQARPLLTRALAEGADLVGGAPHIAPDPEGAIDFMLDLAGECGRDLDLHTDESDNPAINTLEYLAERKLATGFPGTVTAGHCCSLSAMDEATSQRVIEKVAAAGIHVITLPSCNLYLMGRDDRGLIRRGLTRVHELRAAGVNVAFASDNIRDVFNPFGKADMLQEALIAAHALRLGTAAGMKVIVEMATCNPARIMNLPDYGLQPGSLASLVVLDDFDLGNAVAAVAPRRYVFSNGRLVAQTVVHSELLL